MLRYFSNEKKYIAFYFKGTYKKQRGGLDRWLQGFWIQTSKTKNKNWGWGPREDYYISILPG